MDNGNSHDRGAVLCGAVLCRAVLTFSRCSATLVAGEGEEGVAVGRAWRWWFQPQWVGWGWLWGGEDGEMR